EDKSKSERVRKFYNGATVVEFPRFTPMEARKLAQTKARELGLDIGGDEVQMLVEATGAVAAAIATEIEKLALYVGKGRRVTAEDIASMTPHAEAATIFELVA